MFSGSHSVPCYQRLVIPVVQGEEGFPQVDYFKPVLPVEASVLMGEGHRRGSEYQLDIMHERKQIKDNMLLS